MSDNLPGLSALGGAGHPLTRAQWRERACEREALQLWIDGKTVVQIRAALGLENNDEARAVLQRGQERWEHEEFAIHAGRYRAAQLSDLMELRKILMDASRGGDNMAPEKALKVWDRLSRLMGLDAEKDESKGGPTIIVTSVESAMRAAPEVIEAEYTEEDK